MPVLPFIPLIAGVAGAGLSAAGGGGNQGGVRTSQTGTSSNSFQNQGSNTTTPLEDPLFTAFRQQMLPALASAYQEAQAPVFGDTQKAQFLNDQNSIFNTGADSLSSSLARRGLTNSGALASGLSGLAQNRASNATNYFSSIPFLNEQAKSQRTGNLLSLATNFLGRSPLGQQSNTSQSGTSQGTTSSTGNTQQYGPPFLSSFMNNLGGLFGLAANGQGPLSNIQFGNKGGGNSIGGNLAAGAPVNSSFGVNLPSNSFDSAFSGLMGDWGV